MRSLRTKTVVWALGPTALVLVVVASIILFAYEQAMRDVVKDWETELARTSAARLSEGMDQYRSLLSTMAGSEPARSS